MTASQTEVQLARAVVELKQEQARELRRPMAERSPSFATWHARMNEALPAYAAARGVRVGDRVQVFDGLAAHWGRPLGDVVRIAKKTAVVRLWYDGSEHRLPVNGLRLDGGLLVDDAVELVASLRASEPLAPEYPVVIISCGGRKASEPAPAAELYTGSYFRAALAAARALTSDDRIRVLSGRHGFVRLDDVIPPYEQRIDGPGAISDAELSRTVDGDHLLFRVRQGDVACHILAGAAYAAKASQALGGEPTVPYPLGIARGIGDHLRYFAQIAASDEVLAS
jgi:hypothetical protein